MHISALFYAFMAPIVGWLLPFVLAYAIEYGIKIADDIHMPSKNFSLLTHIVLSATLAGILLTLSLIVIKQNNILWFFMMYPVTAYIINIFNMVCTKAEAEEIQKG